MTDGATATTATTTTTTTDPPDTAATTATTTTTDTTDTTPPPATHAATMASPERRGPGLGPGPLPPIPEGVNAGVNASATGATSYGPRPAAGATALPAAAQLRALLQTRLSVRLADGRLLLGTLTSVDSTSVLLSAVEELRTVASHNVRAYWPWSRDGINAACDDGGAGAGATYGTAGVARAPLEGARGGDGVGGAEDGEGDGARKGEGEGEGEGEGDGEDARGLVGQVGGGGPHTTVRRRELQSILVQFAHCRSIEMDAGNHAAWRRYCELPAELAPAPAPAPAQQMGALSLGRDI